MTARVFCKVGELRGLAAEIGEEATLGRSRQATIPLSAHLVSGEHARIRYDKKESCYVLEDLGSTNGTELDGMKVRGRERLSHLHVITLAGTYDLIFQDLELSAKRHGGRAEPLAKGKASWDEDTEADGLPLKLPTAIAGAGEVSERTTVEPTPIGVPSFLAGTGEVSERTFVEPAPIGVPSFLAAKADEIRTVKPPVFGLEVDKPEGVERFRLAEGENLVGRVESAALRLDVLDVSRRHAVLTVSGGKVTVRDLGSSNHTYVDGLETEGTVDVPLGATLGFGSLEARLIRWEGKEP